MTTNSPSNLLSILKDEPKQIPEGQCIVSFSRKSTAKNPVADSEKQRFVLAPVLPAVCAYVGSNEASSILSAALSDLLDSTRSQILQAAFVADTSIEEIDASRLDLSSILEVLEQRQSSTSLTSERIAQWYDASKTAEGNATRYGTDETAKKKSKMLRDKYLSLASGNSGITPDQATRFLGYMAEADLQHPIGASIVRKLQGIISKAIDADAL